MVYLDFRGRDFDLGAGTLAARSVTKIRGLGQQWAGPPPRRFVLRLRAISRAVNTSPSDSKHWSYQLHTGLHLDQ